MSLGFSFSHTCLTYESMLAIKNWLLSSCGEVLSAYRKIRWVDRKLFGEMPTFSPPARVGIDIGERNAQQVTYAVWRPARSDRVGIRVDRGTRRGCNHRLRQSPWHQCQQGVLDRRQYDLTRGVSLVAGRPGDGPVPPVPRLILAETARAGAARRRWKGWGVLLVISAAAAVVLLIASYHDIRHRSIPNWLPLSVAGGALLKWLVIGQFATALWAVAAGAIVFIVSALL